MVPVVLQARGDEGHVQAARRAARLVLLRLRARARLARAPAQLGRSEPTPAHAPGRAREGAERTDDRGGASDPVTLRPFVCGVHESSVHESVNGR